MKNTGRKTHTISLIVIAILAIIAIALGFFKQDIYDWYALLDYQPPMAISLLATQDGMKPYTKHVFYVNHPVLDGKNNFASVCPNDSEQTVVLGCYHTGQRGIFLLSVNNSQLYGIEQVTAAYETLHAIYQRLPSSQQNTLNSELVSFENSGLTDPEVKAQIASFRVTEPGSVLNEMTSLFGTEVQNLPPALSAFYSQYFTSRQTLLNYYDAYQSAFTSRQQQISSYSNQLSSLDSQITTEESSLQTQNTNIQQQQNTLNSEESSGNITGYNAGVGSYNSEVDQYNLQIVTVKTQVNQYNQIVDARNSLVLEVQQLAKAISSPSTRIN